MNNHIHLILQPTTKEGLQKALKPLYMRYSQYINKQQNITGILWQGRFFSSPLDEQYTYYGFAYVENNPVKAKMVENATDYKYSSAMCHAGLVNNSLVTDYDIGVLPSEYQDYLKSMVGVQHDKTLRDLCINRNNHQKPTFHPLGDFLNPALALLGQGLKKSPSGQKLDFAN
ncbi:hypothetical protein BSPWISOX_300, partial [uncultured Gammaproteobacteria bacterium]